MISGTSKTTQASSQTTRNSAIASHGMASVDDRGVWPVGHAACSWWMRSRSSWTMSTKAGSKVEAERARPRQVDRPGHDDAAGPAAHT